MSTGHAGKRIRTPQKTRRKKTQKKTQINTKKATCVFQHMFQLAQQEKNLTRGIWLGKQKATEQTPRRGSGQWLEMGPQLSFWIKGKRSIK